MLRVNINIAIVDMVTTKRSAISTQSSSSECFSVPQLLNQLNPSQGGLNESSSKIDVNAGANNNTLARFVTGEMSPNLEVNLTVPLLERSGNGNVSNRNHFSIVRALFHLFNC